MLQNVSLERLQEIEELRNRTIADENFQEWVKELKVGRMATKSTGLASDMMRSWEECSLTDRFDLVVLRLLNR